MNAMSKPVVRRPSYYEYVCVGCPLFDEGEHDRTYRYTYNMEKHLWRHIEEGDIISAKDFRDILNMKVDYEPEEED